MIIPEKLKAEDEIRIIAPSRSLSIISKENMNLAKQKLEERHYKVTFGKNALESDIMLSSSIKSRIEDLHDAFADKKVKAIFTAIGGYNSNQLLKHIDYELIKNNPKILCGYSDITALANAITAKTGLITYSGIHFSTWAMKQHFQYNEEYFKKCLEQKSKFKINPSENWSDDEWYINQEKREVEKNKGYKLLNEGEAEGTIIGGNLGTLALLFGTQYMPKLKNSILFIEECYSGEQAFASEFDRNLQSLMQQKGFDEVKALVIGRFQKKSEMTKEKIEYILNTKQELKKIPIVYDVDFGHTNPMITFPIGGKARIKAYKTINLEIIKH